MRIFAIISSIIILIGLDQYSKYLFGWVFQSWIFDCFPIDIQSECITRYIPIIGEYLGITVSHNTGIAFSLPLRGLLLQMITIGLIIWLVVYYIYEEYPKKSHLIDTAYVCILAWSIAHGYERIFIGHVVDFISVKYFAILNLADILISIWAILIILAYGYSSRKSR